MEIKFRDIVITRVYSHFYTPYLNYNVYAVGHSHSVQVLILYRQPITSVITQIINVFYA